MAMASGPRAARWCPRDRSIRVLVSPTPVTFAERRAVLQVLEQHGPVEVFTMTPGYHANFVSVTKEPTTAQMLVANSPLTYRIPVSRAHSDISTPNLGEPASFSNQVLPVTSGLGKELGKELGEEPESAVDADADANEEEGVFRLEIFPEPHYNHRHAASGSPLNHSWPPAHVYDKSFMATTLRQSLPKTMAAKGLSHWFFDVTDVAGKGSIARRLQVKNWLPSVMKKAQAGAMSDGPIRAQQPGSGSFHDGNGRTRAALPTTFHAWPPRTGMGASVDTVPAADSKSGCASSASADTGPGTAGAQ